MYHNFISLEQDKRDRIINVAMSEFALRGFKNASTNEIVKKSGISKGALFHYFSTKKALFEFLYNYNLQLFMDIFIPKLETLPSDVFDKWCAFAALKMETIKQYPQIFAFMLAASKEEDSQIQAFLSTVKTDFTHEFTQKLYADIAYYKFKEELDVAKALEIIWWTLEGFAMKMQKEVSFEKMQSNDYVQENLAQMKTYLTLLKQQFYKEEFR